MEVTDRAEVFLPEDVIAHAVIAHRLTHNGYMAGRVSVSFYQSWTNNPQIQELGPRQTLDWNTLSSPPLLRVSDFLVPSQFRSCGIGTVAWSLLAKSSARLGISLRIRGSLSSVDCVSNESNVHTAQGPLVPVPNLARRNRLWQRIIAPQAAIFVCDTDGNGFFEGDLVDPIPRAKAFRFPLRWG